MFSNFQRGPKKFTFKWFITKKKIALQKKKQQQQFLTSEIAKYNMYVYHTFCTKTLNYVIRIVCTYIYVYTVTVLGVSKKRKIYNVIISNTIKYC